MMIYSLKGKLEEKEQGFFVVDCQGIGFKVFTNKQTVARLPLKQKKDIKVFCYLYFCENRLELYGFLDKKTVDFFALLNNVSSVGPKTALCVLDAGIEQVSAAIQEKQADFIAKIPGVGRRAAERMVLELKDKVKLQSSKKITAIMKIDQDIESVLCGLGYERKKAKESVSCLGKTPVKFEERLKKALKEISRL